MAGHGMSFTLRYAARSDRGLIREANEDSVYAGPRLLAVADGMGGMAAGEVASNIVIGALAPLDEDAPSNEAVEALRSHIEEANQRLRRAVEENPALDGMGTTLTAMLFTGNRIALVHVGDSRAYVWHGDELTQITRDDTYVQMLVDEGRITAEEATTHPQRSLLTRALDGREVDPDSSVREARVGDRYLLCSDGLSGVVSAETMTEAMRLADPGQAADRLIQLALRGGGPDNITVVVADVVESAVQDDVPVVGGAAAADRGRKTAAGSDSAAGRAALAKAPPESEPDEDDDDVDDQPTVELDRAARRRKRARNLIIGACVVALLLVGGFVGWRYTQRQYYVGATDDGNVAIYRGVRGSVAGIKFSSVVEETNLKLDDLDELARADVKDTIWARNRGAADEQITKLEQRLLPLCESLQSTDPAAAAETSPAPEASQTPGVDPGQSPTPSAAGESDPEPAPGENCRESAGTGGLDTTAAL